MNPLLRLIFLSIFLVTSLAQGIETSHCLRFYNPKFYSEHRASESDALLENIRRSVKLIRKHIVEKYLQLKVTDQADRTEFMKSRNLPPAPNRLVIEFENSKLKFLNDAIKDKDLITAIDNMANSYMLRHMEKWFYRQFEGITIKKYSDGKSLSLIIEAKENFNEHDLKNIDVVFEQFQTNLAALLKERKVFRDSDKVEDWFRMGVGQTVEQAYFAARASRNLSGPNRVVHYSDIDIQTELWNLIFHGDRSSILKSPQLKSMMITESNSGKTIPSLDLFEILRKAKTNSALIAAAKYRFKIELSDNDATQLLLYSEIIDLLNPKFFVVDQTVVTLAEAEHGGAVIDKKGMGAKNQMASAIAVAQAKDTMDFIARNRIEEEKVTNEINLYRERMEEIWSALCRGDDCATLDTRHLNIKDFLNHSLILGQRVVFIPAGVPHPEWRSELSTHGETQEKLFIEALKKHVDHDTLKTMTFAIDFKTTTLGSGEVNLIVNSMPAHYPTEQTLLSIKKAFQEAISEFNREQAEQHKETSYSSSEVIVI